MVLEADWLDRTATHRRLTTVIADAYGDDEIYQDLEIGVPLRFEQREVDPAVAPPGEAIDYVAWVLPSISNVPESRDRFVVDGGPTLDVESVEELTGFDGEIDHYELGCKVIDRG